MLGNGRILLKDDVIFEIIIIESSKSRTKMVDETSHVVQT